MEVIPAQLAGMNAKADDLISFMNDLGYRPHKEVDDTDWEWTFR
jgi:hypothetical protein